MSVIRTRFQLWGGVFLLVGGMSYPIAYAGWRFLRLDFIATFSVSALVLLLCTVGAFHFFRRKDVEIGRIMEPSIHYMEISEAARAAQTALSDASRFVVVRRDADSFGHADELAHHLRQFFAQIESVKAVRGDARLDRTAICPSSLNPNYLRIGNDIESLEIVVLPGSEIVYELDTFDPSSPVDQHRSVYHWVLAVDGVLYGD